VTAMNPHADRNEVRVLLIALGAVEFVALCAMGWWPGAEFPFPGLALFATAFAVYALAGWRITEQADPIKLIWSFAIAMRVALLALTPELSDDVYRYLWDGHVQLSGTNPYLYAPDAPEVEALRTAYHALINNPTVPTIYPPLAQAAFLLIAAAGSSLLAAKALWIGCDLATGVVLGRIARATGRNEPRVLLLYLWSPLLIVEVAWSGHLEPLGLLTLSLVILLATRLGQVAGKTDHAPPPDASPPESTARSAWIPVAAGSALALSALTKFAPAAALPALIRRAGWGALAGFMFTGIALYAPFASAGPELFTGLRTYSEHWWFMKGPFFILELIAGDPTRARYLAAGLVIGIIGWTAAARYDVDRALLWVLGAGMILTPTLHPWYVLWMMPMAALRTSRPWILLSGLAFIGYFGLGGYQDGGAWAQPILARVAMWVPFLCLLFFDGARGKLRPDSRPDRLEQSG
jgi:alpha-1,6-mannosyltransferase